MNVLISSAGRRVSLVKSFINELKKIEAKGLVYASDMNPELSSACAIAHRFIKVPAVTDSNYIDVLLNMCLQYGIKLIVPTIDTELKVLSQAKEKFRSKGIEIAISNLNWITVFSDKRETANFFMQNSVEAIKELDRENLEFPSFVKPIRGSSSLGARKLDSSEDVAPSLLKDNTYIFQKYFSKLAFDEYTLDMYFDRNGLLKTAVPRKRIATRAGEVSKSKTEKNELLKLVSEKFNHIDGLHGVITMQFFIHKENRSIVGIEVNPRFGGGYPLSYRAGANFSKNLIQEYVLGKNIIPSNNWQEGLTMLRFDDEVYV